MEGKNGARGEPDVMDVFDSLLEHEERSREAGVSDGNHQGEVDGHMEGFAFGWSKGWEIITEIGFYKGYAMRFRDRLIHPSSSIDDVPSEGTLRKQQAVSSFLDVISRISFDDIKNGAISDDILLARRKFKQVFPNVYSPRITVAEEISF